MSTPGKRLRALRVKRELTQGQVSRRSGVDRAYLSKVENDVVRPSNEFLRRVGLVLGMDDVLEALDVLARYQR
jgi:transcriptional regulator with XRE-family HTH domain